VYEQDDRHLNNKKKRFPLKSQELFVIYIKRQDRGGGVKRKKKKKKGKVLFFF